MRGRFKIIVYPISIQSPSSHHAYGSTAACWTTRGGEGYFNTSTRAVLYIRWYCISIRPICPTVPQWRYRTSCRSAIITLIGQRHSPRRQGCGDCRCT